MRFFLFFLALLAGCISMECRVDHDCKGDRVCDPDGRCAEPPDGAAALDMSARPAPDLRQPLPLPDLAPRACVFDRDCGAERCCSGRCVPWLDRNNCGPCGTNCGTDPGIQCCGDKMFAYCMNIRSDPKNCGACGRICPDAPQALGMCCDGLCKDRLADPKNCGACGIDCDAQGKRCVRAMCQ
jgi:hypothetical protein